jgi:hypothetical protein
MYTDEENCWFAHLLLVSYFFGEFINVVRASPRAAPKICAAIKGATELGAMPANVSESVLATVTAGLAKLVDEVKKYAADM